MKLTKEEQKLKSLYEKGAIKMRIPSKAELLKFRAAAENIFRKDRRINIRLSEHAIV